MTRRLALGAALLAAVLVTPGPAPAQWPHLAGKPLRSAPIHVDAEGSVYVVNPDADSVTRLSPLAGGTQTKLWEAPVGDYPRTLTLWGSSVLTANQKADTISRIRMDDGARELTDVPLGFGCAPYGISGNHSGTRLYVSCQGTQELVVLAEDLSVITRVRLDWPQPRAVAVSGDDSRVYVSHYLTIEPNDDAHVSEIDGTTDALTSRRVLTIPADRSTCETQNSGQGVTNIVNAIALTPSESPVAGQLWVGGTMQANLTKGLFKRYAGFRGRPELSIFDMPCPDDPAMSCRFESFPRGDSTAALKRNLYKASFHDITRFVIWKVDVASGNVVGKIDIDEANNATDFTFSSDGKLAYVVDQTFHTFHVFNVRRGQDGNPSTLFASVANTGPFSADPSKGCVADALGSAATPERRFLPGFEPQAQITPIDGFDAVRLDAMGTAQPVDTGVDFDTRKYHETGEAAMRQVRDSIGTAPFGVTLSPDGCIAYVANYLSRNVVAVSAQPGIPACSTPAQTVDFRCSRDIGLPCRTFMDCPAAGGFCNHPGGQSCTADTDCPANLQPCVRDNSCVPLLVADAVSTTAVVTDEIPAEILDGKILFNTAARDDSVPNGIGLGAPAPLFEAVRKGCSTDALVSCRTDAECPGGTCGVVSLPGEVVSVAHDASYVTCTACHADFGGQDGRTWDFSQFGASLRNTMDLRGRSQAAPGECAAVLSRNPGRVGTACHFDAECGSGSEPGACVGNPDMTPPYLTGDDARRYFNPMITEHWNGDRMEVEAFEFTYRSLLGAGDCDGTEHDPAKCLGALLPRSLLISTAKIPTTGGRFEGDLRGSLRNIMVDEPTLGKKVNASIRLSHLADYVYSMTEFPKDPFLGSDGTSPSDAAVRGRRIFNDATTGCASCHNGPTPGAQLFSDKRPIANFSGQPGAAANNIYVRHFVNTANMFDETDPDKVAKETGYQDSVGSTTGQGIPASRGPLRDYVTPVLNDVWNTPPFLHDGSAPTLLDVIRPCDSAQADCNQKGLGRNVDDKHGVTSVLTPQQLNDLVAFQLAPHNPVGTTEHVVKAGPLTLKKLLVSFGKRPGRGHYVLVGTASPGALGVDPASAGLRLTLAVPKGPEMVLHEVAIPAGDVHGNRRKSRFSAHTRGREVVTISLKRLRNGDFRVVVKGRGADLSALDNGTADVTVALVAGEAQFVRNRLLIVKKRTRSLVLEERHRRT